MRTSTQSIEPHAVTTTREPTDPHPRVDFLAHVPSGFLDALAESPVAYRAYRNTCRALATGHLPACRRELIALAVAEIDGSAYGLSEHYQRARAAGLSAEAIHAARLGRSEDPALDALLRFTVAVTLKRGDVSREDLQILPQAGIGVDAIGEIIANIAQCMFADYFTRVVRAAIDQPLLRPGAERPARRSRFGHGRPRRAVHRSHSSTKETS